MTKTNFSSKSGLRLTILLALTILACGFSDNIQDGRGEFEEETALAERVKTLESLLTQQVDKMSQMEDMLRMQTEKMSAQNTLFRAQAEHLAHQETLLCQQDNRLLEQDDAIRQLKQTVQQLEEDQAKSKAQTRQKSYSVSGPNSDEDEVLTQDSRSDHRLKTQQSVQLGVAVRSDDSGPLEVVVSQMGQQLTEMTAEMKALKTHTDTEIQSLKNTNADQNQKIQDAHTSTFVHWGSSQCGNGSQLVYSGVVGGSLYSQTGAATNYLCLTMSPVPSDHSFQYAAELYGSEYYTYDSHNYKDAVCAVCRSSHSTTIMIPGTNVCNAGWHRQYSGYLLAGYYDHAAGSEFICVDSSMESRPGTSQIQNGKLLYFTKAVCGTLPCDPYINGKVVTCVVCSL